MSDGTVLIKQDTDGDRAIDNELVLNDLGAMVYRQKVAVANLPVDDDGNLKVTVENAEITVEIGTSVEISNDVGDPVPISGTVIANLGTIGAAATETTLAALPSRANSFKTRVDTFTTTANGTTVDLTTFPLAAYAIQVKGTGAIPSLWDVRLEGSLDGTNFSQILQHTNSTGDGAVLYSGAVLSPSLYFRSRCAGLTLGTATGIVVTVLGAVA